MSHTWMAAPARQENRRRCPPPRRPRAAPRGFSSSVRLCCTTRHATGTCKLYICAYTYIYTNMYVVPSSRQDNRRRCPPGRRPRAARRGSSSSVRLCRAARQTTGTRKLYICAYTYIYIHIYMYIFSLGLTLQNYNRVMEHTRFLLLTRSTSVIELLSRTEKGVRKIADVCLVHWTCICTLPVSYSPFLTDRCQPHIRDAAHSDSKSHTTPVVIA